MDTKDSVTPAPSPAQILNKRIGPRNFVSMIMTGFGVVTMCTAFSFNYGGIITCRLMLGIFEAGLFPGVIYVLSYWYSRWELQTRICTYHEDDRPCHL